MRLKAVVILLALIAPAALAQQPSSTPGTLGTPGTAGTFTVRGVVLTANDAPLARVRVAQPGQVAGVLTDVRGQFSLDVPDTQSVRLRLSFKKAGYADYTADVPRAQLNDGMRIRLLRGGAISGQVLDRTGARVMRAEVVARHLTADPASESISTTTNDLGEFRFGGLAEGAYGIMASPGGGGLATDEEEVNVEVGGEVGNITFTLEMPSGRLFAPIPDSGSLGTASMRGRVVNQDGLPVAGAAVAALRNGEVPRLAETDARGLYVIERLTPGDYTVEARRNGYINRQYGQDRTAAAARRVTLQQGQAVGSIDVMLARGGVIAGMIVDEFGEPVLGASVNALEMRMVAGRMRAFRSAGVRTDDRGHYRLFGLQPGTYVIQAQIPETVSAVDGYLPQYFPATATVDQATPTKVDLSAVVGGVDITLVPARAHRVTGTVLGLDRRPASVGLLLMVSERSGAIQTEPVQARANNGSFVFTNVPPGEYVVQAMAGTSSPSPELFARMVARQFASSFVTVTTVDPLPVTLQLSPGATLTGSVTYEGIAPTPTSSVTMIAVPTDFDRGPIIGTGSTGFSLQPDNTFEYKGVFGPSLLVAQSRNPDWYLKSITFNGRELADASFDFGLSGEFRDIKVVISGSGASLTGRVTDERAAAVRDYSIVLFPTASERWTNRSRWLRTARPAQDGQFRLTGLVPGEYWVAAVDRLEGNEASGDLQNPGFLESLTSRARRIAFGEGQSQDLTLRLIHR